MSTIARIEISHHTLPLQPAFKASWDGRPRHNFDVTIVRVTDSDGRVGIGSGDRMVGFEGHEELFVGQDPQQAERHYEVLSHLNFHYGRPWPLDLALWDLNGQITGEPVWRMLGGRSNRVRLYASTGVLRGADAMVDQAQRLAEEGFTAMKVRFTSSEGGRAGWREDLRVLERIRVALGDRLALMVDCNQGWRMPWDTNPSWQLKDALMAARELEKLSVYWMEEPLHRADRRGMAQLRAMTSVRIAGGEMTRELHEYRDLIDDRALDILQPDVTLTGGISGVRRIATTAREAGVALTPHTWTNGIGVLANAHLAAGIGEVQWMEWPYDPPEWSLERRDWVLDQPLRARDGWFELSEAPGLGIVLAERLQR
jgi:L-rhamnonate dehydratase